MTPTIAFDADDTLWHNESLFAITTEMVTGLLKPYADEATLSLLLLETEKRNLRLFGYGVKGFTLSMIESAIEVSQGKVTATVIQAILEAGKGLLAHQIQLLPHVRETLEALYPYYNLMLITKGDLFHQESRIAMSGLGDLFSAMEVVSEKSPSSYQRILKRYHLRPDNFVMVGNSIRSDILPVVALGAQAIYIPYEVTWEHEKADLSEADPRLWRQATSIRQVPQLLEATHPIDR